MKAFGTMPRPPGFAFAFAEPELGALGSEDEDVISSDVARPTNFTQTLRSHALPGPEANHKTIIKTIIKLAGPDI